MSIISRPQNRTKPPVFLGGYHGHYPPQYQLLQPQSMCFSSLPPAQGNNPAVYSPNNRIVGWASSIQDGGFPNHYPPQYQLLQPQSMGFRLCLLLKATTQQKKTQCMDLKQKNMQCLSIVSTKVKVHKAVLPFLDCACKSYPCLVKLITPICWN